MTRGFVLAYPQSESARQVEMLGFSMVVFGISCKSYAVAAGAANFMRDVSTKVDFLTERSRETQAISKGNETTDEWTSAAGPQVIEGPLAPSGS